jgi:hypothetical protein
MHHPVIGYGHGLDFLPGGSIDKFVDADGTVQQAIRRMDVKMNEWRHSGSLFLAGRSFGIPRKSRFQQVGGLGKCQAVLFG